MASTSVDGTGERNTSSALLRISQAVHGLFDTLEELREVETALLGQGTAAEGDHGGSNAGSVGLVAGTLREMVGKLVTDINENPEVRKLLMLIQQPVPGATSDSPFLQDSTPTEQPSYVIGRAPSVETETVCIPRCLDYRALKRVALRNGVSCRHSCKHHPELLDPFLWSTLPEDVVELVFARLSTGKIIALREQSAIWSAMAKSSNFRGVFSESHPEIFGLMRWDKAGKRFWNLTYDIKSKEWMYQKLDGLSEAIRASNISVQHDRYRDSMFASDGGLVCFVPRADYSPFTILVGNPLTDEWKALPLLSQARKDALTLVTVVQLVVDEDTRCYRVVLVRGKTDEGCFLAHCFDSKTGEWSSMVSGLVYGDSVRRFNNNLRESWDNPVVHDCTTGKTHELIDCLYGEGDYEDSGRFALVKERLFMLGAWSPDPHVNGRFTVSEFAWETSVSKVSRKSSIECNLPRDYQGYLYACKEFLLGIADNCEEGDDHHQRIRLYDLSAERWQELSMGDNCKFTNEELNNIFMCELRWDAVL
ncbi:hypothetical protein M758_2G135200 [Ceratodon purpureus]|nr:hypothetical protein M758_2G135200 [Ceratodon purpureus]KAG0626564.1 hypothetical protein M758_2G135200 [Ceratodon purpureus]KAG0626565.1 hypothetical protein M758_2G135200 [Ceratodon purpureus]